MKLYFIVSAKDVSEEYFENAVLKEKISYEFIYFKDLSYIDRRIYNSLTSKELSFEADDRIIIRLPWTKDVNVVDYDVFVHYLAQFYYKNIALDRKVFSNHAGFYEDKLFQSFLFEKNNIKLPKTLYYSERSRLQKSVNLFPVVAKKRISTRGRGNFVLKDKKELLSFFASEDPKQYILQDMVDAKLDLRVLVFQGKVIGAISRNMHVRDRGRLVVKGAEMYESISDDIKKSCIKVAESIGGDFVGVDVMVDKKDRHYIIEGNVHPQFSTFTDTTGIPVAEILVQELFKK